MIAHAAVPDVPPIIRVARTYMKATARAAGDTALEAGYAWTPDELTASAFGRTTDRGRLRPTRIPGVRDWTCGPASPRGRTIRCRVTVTGDAWSATIRYRAAAGTAEISIALVAR